MSTAYFSKSMNCFIPESWKDDGTYSAENWPSDAVLLTIEECDTYWKVSPPPGKQLGSSDDGKPAWVDAPLPALTYAQELTALTAPYNADRDTLCAAWLRAAVADGTEETVRKEDVESEIAELDAQYDADVAALKTKYGVS